jgi:hypothetical protein
MGNSNGIVSQGVSTELICNKCNEKFITDVGTITIKGTTPTKKLCQKCQNDNMEKWILELKKNGHF